MYLDAIGHIFEKPFSFECQQKKVGKTVKLLFKVDHINRCAIYKFRKYTN